MACIKGRACIWCKHRRQSPTITRPSPGPEHPVINFHQECLRLGKHSPGPYTPRQTTIFVERGLQARHTRCRCILRGMALYSLSLIWSAELCCAGIGSTNEALHWAPCGRRISAFVLNGMEAASDDI